MSHYLLDKRQREGWTGEVCMLHAELHGADWKQTPAYVREFAERKGVPLYVVSAHTDLIDRIWQRYHQNKDRPPWPSSKIRYCTSYGKRDPISKFLRNHFASGDVICAIGLRSSESHARAKRPTFQLRKDSSAPTKGRFVYDWLPIHDWTTEQVWQTIREHGDIAHPAYKLPGGAANERLSCALCILASVNDLINGAVHNPDIYREYCRIEAVTGYSFRQGLWLSDLKPELLPESTLTAVQLHKQRKSS